ncbi:MAG: hypothetical protein C4549_01780 [Deltaproteobacteria bacterium]|nr:MAG: hypothetical protein C4549_01780 [Deltaproteobacteria bacterium]
MIDDKDSSGPGFKDSSEMLKNYKELKDAEIPDKITIKQTLESLNPRILDHFLTTNWEKNL